MLTKSISQSNQNLTQLNQLQKKTFVANNFILVTANDYATTIGFQVLKDGGNAVDSAIAVQLVLGLVEPQSSGIGGGTFITFFDAKTRKTYSYEGREKSPKKIPSDIFIDKNGNPKKFFDAAIGGASVGVHCYSKNSKTNSRRFWAFRMEYNHKLCNRILRRRFYPISEID